MQLFAVGIHAQSVDSTMQNAIRLLKVNPSAAQVLRVLRPANTARAKAQAEQLADTIVAMVTDTLTHNIPSLTRANLIGVLAEAGMPGKDGAVFPTLLVRLTKIAEDAPWLPDRGRALAAIVLSPDKPSAIRIVESIAVSDNPIAYMAVLHLWADLGTDGGLEVARALWQNNRVTEPKARESLAFAARKFGWR